MFKARLTKPEAGNKYYNRIMTGGYSGAIMGSPRMEGCDTLANCVGYAAGRFNEIIGQNQFVYFQYPPNAEDFYDTGIKQGLKVGQTPQLGAIIVWAKGKTWTAGDGAGHVAVVEKINSDGSIITSESGYGCKNPFWTTHREKGSGNWGAGTEYRFLGFVYQPGSEPEPTPPEPEKYIKKGDKGEDVVWLQTKLTKCGYLPKGQIDGDFGKITLGALCGFQLENGLDADGICGPMTKTKLE